MCHLPKGVFPIAGISVGWPNENNEVSIGTPMKMIFMKIFITIDMLKSTLIIMIKLLNVYNQYQNQSKDM